MAEDRARENGLNALKTVKKVLTKMGLEPEPTDLEEVLRVDFSKDNIPIAEALADVRVDYERFLYYLVFRDKVPVKYRKEVMEFVTRVNFDMVIGNFELNLDDGLLRFKSGLDFTKVKLSEALIRGAIACAKDAVEEYADALVAVMQGKQTASQAFKDAEA